MKRINRDIQNIMALATLVAVIAYIYLLCTRKIPDGNENMVNFFGLILAALMAKIGNHYFDRIGNDQDDTTR